MNLLQTFIPFLVICGACALRTVNFTDADFTKLKTAVEKAAKVCHCFDPSIGANSTEINCAKMNPTVMEADVYTYFTNFCQDAVRVIDKALNVKTDDHTTAATNATDDTPTTKEYNATTTIDNSRNTTEYNATTPIDNSRNTTEYTATTPIDNLSNTTEYNATTVVDNIANTTESSETVNNTTPAVPATDDGTTVDNSHTTTDYNITTTTSKPGSSDKIKGENNKSTYTLAAILWTAFGCLFLGIAIALIGKKFLDHRKSKSYTCPPEQNLAMRGS